MCSSKVARDAARYPFMICKAILTGIHQQLQRKQQFQAGIHALLPGADMMCEEDQILHTVLGHEDEAPEEYGL